MTVALCLTMRARLFLMPWLPMPESRKPWKGKCCRARSERWVSRDLLDHVPHGPYAHGGSTCMVHGASSNVTARQMIKRCDCPAAPVVPGNSEAHVWAAGWGCVDLHRARLHGIADVDGLVDVLREHAALRNKTGSSVQDGPVAHMRHKWSCWLRAHDSATLPQKS